MRELFTGPNLSKAYLDKLNKELGHIYVSRGWNTTR